MKRGCGLVCLHYAVEPAYAKVGWPEPEIGADGKPVKQVPPAGRGSSGAGAKEFQQWLGGYFEQHWSVNPHWEASFKEFPKHPVSNGVKPFSTTDEWYYHMRFRTDGDGVTYVLSALPPADTLKRPDGPHSGNPAVREAVARGEKQTVAWARQRPDGGRGFGFTGGHFHWTWANDQNRKMVLNAIAWIAKVEVPANGVASSRPTLAELRENQDWPVPEKFDFSRIEKEINDQ
jgi:type 1 glutamine amidotransferase